MPKRKQIKSLSNVSVKHKRLSSAPLTEFNPKSRTMRNQNVTILETPVKSLRSEYFVNTNFLLIYNLKLVLVIRKTTE